jgi:hypothetical protein
MSEPRASRLHEPLAHPPLVLLQQHSARLGQRLRADIVERPEDALAIFDGERHYLTVESERLLEEGARRLVPRA